MWLWIIKLDCTQQHPHLKSCCCFEAMWTPVRELLTCTYWVLKFKNNSLLRNNHVSIYLCLRPAAGVTLWWRGQQWLASDIHRAQSKWIFASVTKLLLPAQIALLLNQHPIWHLFDTVNLEGTTCQTRLGHFSVSISRTEGRKWDI